MNTKPIPDRMLLIVDCKGIASIEEFWDRYESTVGMQNCAWFGRNLDALWDALEGGGPGRPDASHLVFENARDLEGLKTARGVPFLRALYEIAAEVSRIKVEVV